MIDETWQTLKNMRCNNFRFINSFPRYWRLLSSADNVCKQFEPRSGPTKSKLFDTLMVFLKDCFEKVNFKTKSTVDQKKKKKEKCEITQHAKSYFFYFLFIHFFLCSTCTFVALALWSLSFTYSCVFMHYVIMYRETSIVVTAPSIAAYFVVSLRTHAYSNI